MPARTAVRECAAASSIPTSTCPRPRSRSGSTCTVDGDCGFGATCNTRAHWGPARTKCVTPRATAGIPADLQRRDARRVHAGDLPDLVRLPELDLLVHGRNPWYVHHGDLRHRGRLPGPLRCHVQRRSIGNVHHGGVLQHERLPNPGATCAKSPGTCVMTSGSCSNANASTRCKSGMCSGRRVRARAMRRGRRVRIARDL